MKKIQVLDATGRKLAPCHPARARELLRRGKATRQTDPQGNMYLQLTYVVRGIGYGR